MSSDASSQPNLPPPVSSPGAERSISEPPAELRVIAGRYRLLELIAEGGMGSVYLAEHVLSRKKLALKVVHPYLCKGRQGVERFRREVSAAADIDHPGIVQVYDAGVDDDGGFFMAMELLDGESLGDLLRREWPGMATSVKIIEGILEPLARAHEKNFIHRDIKPDNIFLAIDIDGNQRIKLLDFGLARDVEKSGPTQTGITFGTPEYMSPEQAISARKVRAPGDVWSVAVMLYELLCGEHPFSGETPNLIMANAIKEPLPSLSERAPHVPEPLVHLVEHCLEKNPAERPQGAGEMLRALRVVLEDLTLDETVPTVEQPTVDWDQMGPTTSGPDLAYSYSAETVVPHSSPARRRARMTPKVFWTTASMLSIAALLLGSALIYRSYSSPSDDSFGPTDTDLAHVETESVPSPAVAEPALADLATAEPALADLAMAEPALAEPAVAEPAVAEPAAEPAIAEAAAEPAAVEPERVRRPRRAAPRARPQQSHLDEAALTRWRSCAARGDQACVIRVLAGNARTAQERSSLITAYEGRGQTGQVIGQMREFLSRYPAHRLASRYQAFLDRH